MIAKIVSGHGTGSAAPAIHYITGEKDHNGNVRDEVIHLFGDGQQIIDLTESMTCKHTYLSSVLSFTQEESARLNLDDIKQLAESFAAHHADPMGVGAIAGCSELHVENGRYDVHLVQVQMDMESGKRVDLYLDSCGDTQRIADWQDCKNYEVKLDDPRDPSRMRLTYDRVRESTDREEMRKLVNHHLEQQTIKGKLTSRSDVLHELQSLGFEIKRQNKKTISIKSPDLNQNIRLTGVIFHESFRGIEGVRGTIEAGERRCEDDYRRQYETAQARLAESNKKRIKRISKKLHIEFKKNPRGIQACNLQDTAADLDSIALELSAAHRNRNMGRAAVQHPEPNGNIECLSNSAISGKPVHHRSASEHITRSERKRLDQNTGIGTNHDIANHKIPNHRVDGSRTHRHTETMRGLSTCSREIEQASQRLGSPGESGGSPFDRARKAIVESIDEIANHIETIALRMKQFISRSAAEDDGVANDSEISSDDIGY